MGAKAKEYKAITHITITSGADIDPKMFTAAQIKQWLELGMIEEVEPEQEQAEDGGKS